MSKATSREQVLQKRADRLMEQWKSSGQRGFLRSLVEGVVNQLASRGQKREAMILGRRIEERDGRWELWFDLQYSEEGLRKQAEVCKGKYPEAELARLEMARWPVGSSYRY